MSSWWCPNSATLFLRGSLMWGCDGTWRVLPYSAANRLASEMLLFRFHWLAGRMPPCCIAAIGIPGFSCIKVTISFHPRCICGDSEAVNLNVRHNGLNETCDRPLGARGKIVTMALPRDRTDGHSASGSLDRTCTSCSVCTGSLFHYPNCRSRNCRLWGRGFRFWGPCIRNVKNLDRTMGGGTWCGGASRRFSRSAGESPSGWSRCGSGETLAEARTSNRCTCWSPAPT
jgi:hypothetical protein